MKINEIKEIIAMINSSNITSFKYRDGDTNIEIGIGTVTPISSESFAADDAALRSAPAAGSASAVSTETRVTGKSDSVLVDVTAPLVGVFYSKPSPTSECFVNVGDTVKKGQTLCIVEAMKVMNEVPAAFDMKIAEICAEDSDVVEFGQAIFKVEKL